MLDGEGADLHKLFLETGGAGEAGLRTPLLGGAADTAVTREVADTAAAPSPAREVSEVTGGERPTGGGGGTQISPDFPPAAADEVASRSLLRQVSDAFSRAGPGKGGSEAARIFNGWRRDGQNLATRFLNSMRRVKATADYKPVSGGRREVQPQNVITAREKVFGAIDASVNPERSVRDAVDTFPEAERELVQQTYDFIDETAETYLRPALDYLGINADEALIDGYAPHLFVERVGAKPGGKGGGPSTRFPHRQDQGTLLDVLERRTDLDLQYWDITEMAAQHRIDAQSFAGTVEAIKYLRANNLMKPKGTAGTAGWKSPDLPAFRMGSKMQDFVVHPEAVRSLEAMFSPSVFKTVGVLKVAEAVRDTAFKVKVFGGAFQAIDFSFRSIGRGFIETLRELSPIRGARGGKGVRVTLPNVPGAANVLRRSLFSPITAVARAALPVLDRRIVNLQNNNPIYRVFVRRGHGAGIDPSIGQDAVKGTLGKLVPQTVGGKQIPGADWVQNVLDFMSGDAYGRYHSQMLDQGLFVTWQKHVDALGDNATLRRIKDMDVNDAIKAIEADPEIMRAVDAAVEENNVFFSSVQHWQSAIQNPHVKDAMRFVFFATGELEGLIRMPFQAPAGFAGVIGTTVIAAELLNRKFTGEWLDPSQLLPYDSESGGYNTRFLRPELPDNFRGPNGEKQYLDLLGQLDTVFRIALDPGFATQTRLGQAPRLGADILAIRRGDAPFFGEKVESTSDKIKFGLNQASPIALQSFTSRETLGTSSRVLQSSGLNISSEPLMELLARNFDSLYPTRAPMNREQSSPDMLTAQQDPRLNWIFDEMQKRGEEVGSEFAESARRQEGVLAEEAQSLGFGTDRKGGDLLRGDPDASQALLKNYSDLRQNRAARLSLQYFGSEEPDETDVPGVAALRRIRDMDPFSLEYEDPDTREPDWQRWFADQDKELAIIEKDRPGFTEDYRDRPILGDEFAEVETKILGARRLNSDLFSIPKYRFMSIEQHDEAIDLRAAAERWRDDHKAPNGAKPSIDIGLNAAFAAGDYSSRQILTFANKLRRPSEVRPLITSEYLQHLKDNQDVLEAFYPSLYPRYILERLVRLR